MLLDDNLERENCPDKFYYNCYNAGKSCYECKAAIFKGNSSLKYKPIDSNISELKRNMHPVIKEEKNDAYFKKKEYRSTSKYITAKNNSRKGRLAEKALTRKLSHSTLNISSKGDDGYIRPCEDLQIHYELKLRLNGFRWPSKREWEKFNNSHQGVFIVSYEKEADNRVCMSLETFNQLIETINNLSNDYNK